MQIEQNQERTVALYHCATRSEVSQIMSTLNSPGEYPETGILKGKVVAITGGATGIGRAICLEMLRQGARVSILHLDDPSTATHLVTLTAEIRQLVLTNHPHLTPELPENIPKITELTDEHFLAIPGDISLPETAEVFISETVKRFGKVTTFVSNAGVCKFEEFMDVTPDLLNATVGVNLQGAFWGTQAAARQMIKQGDGGSIIGISSISALVGGAQQVHYTPTKAGVLSLMQSCATALGKYGIRCNAILPGMYILP